MYKNFSFVEKTWKNNSREKIIPDSLRMKKITLVMALLMRKKNDTYEKWNTWKKITSMKKNNWHEKKITSRKKKLAWKKIMCVKKYLAKYAKTYMK